mgnify:CR=1 FL=1
MVIFLEFHDNSTKFPEFVDVFDMPLREVAFGTRHVSFDRFHHIVPSSNCVDPMGALK